MRDVLAIWNKHGKEILMLENGLDLYGELFKLEILTKSSNLRYSVYYED